MSRAASRDEWFSGLAASVAQAGDRARLLLVDAWSGEVLAVSRALCALIGDLAPASVAELVDRGVVARPDRDRIAATVVARRGADRGREGETSHAWTEQVRLHRPDGPSELVELALVHQRWPGLEAEALMVTVTPVAALVDRPADEGSPAWFAIFDRQMRMVAIDGHAHPAGGELLVGAHATVTTHPEDVAAVTPQVLDVLEGRSTRTEYTVRTLDPDGRWYAVHVELRALIGTDTPLFLGLHRPVSELRRVIPAGLLTAREAEVVTGLFDGFRIPQMAERDGVAVSTLRTHLSSIFRKLGVATQAELLAAYHRPTA